MPRTRCRHGDTPALRNIAHTQNFLTDSELVERLVQQAEIATSDLVLEIGPGRGIITAALARQAGRVLAVEKDGALARQLQQRFADEPRIQVVPADILHAPLPRTPYRVFANLPFNATSDIIARLLAAPTPPDDLHLVVQREAAERFRGEPRESLVAVLLKPWFAPSITHRFKRSDFMPAPQVDVVMLRLRKRGPPLVAGPDVQLFRDFAVYGFTAWQPTLLDALESLLGRTRARQAIHAAGISDAAPPGQVPFSSWLRLFDHLKRNHRHWLLVRLAGRERRLRQQQNQLTKRHRTQVRHSRRPPPCSTGISYVPRAG
jgi:23S rRNA (adenine-N6)-dimethyltransferase